jgi:hypothetical protein
MTKLIEDLAADLPEDADEPAGGELAEDERDAEH